MPYRGIDGGHNRKNNDSISLLDDFGNSYSARERLGNHSLEAHGWEEYLVLRFPGSRFLLDVIIYSVSGGATQFQCPR